MFERIQVSMLSGPGAFDQFLEKLLNPINTESEIISILYDDCWKVHIRDIVIFYKNRLNLYIILLIKSFSFTIRCYRSLYHICSSYNIYDIPKLSLWSYLIKDQNKECECLNNSLFNIRLIFF